MIDQQQPLDYAGPGTRRHHPILTRAAVAMSSIRLVPLLIAHFAASYVAATILALSSSFIRLALPSPAHRLVWVALSPLHILPNFILTVVMAVFYGGPPFAANYVAGGIYLLLGVIFHVGMVRRLRNRELYGRAFTPTHSADESPMILDYEAKSPADKSPRPA